MSIWPIIRKMIRPTRLALNSYLEAIAINPDSPAQAAYNMMIRILDFRDSNLYNP